MIFADACYVLHISIADNLLFQARVFKETGLTKATNLFIIREDLSNATNGMALNRQFASWNVS